jgi:hypothetical protein
VLFDQQKRVFGAARHDVIDDLIHGAEQQMRVNLIFGVQLQWERKAVAPFQLGEGLFGRMAFGSVGGADEPADPARRDLKGWVKPYSWPQITFSSASQRSSF